MIILGLNVYHADTAASIIVDGKIIAACEEERFARIKHYTGFPKNSIDFCLKKLNIKITEVDYITVNYNLNYNFYHRLKFAFSIISKSSIFSKIFNLFNKKTISNIIFNIYGVDCSKKIIFIPHHLSHISSSFLTSGFKDAIGISIDATGDFSSMEISKYENNKITVLYKNLFPHSLGILYQAITQFLGFKNYGDEYKIMALAAIGKANYKNEFDEIIKFNPPYGFELNLDYFVHHKQVILENSYNFKPIFENLYSIKLEKLLGPGRKYNEKLSQNHFDIAASLQKKFEEIILKIIKNLYMENHSDNLCFSGGCMFNSVLNGKIYNELNFKNFFFHANVGDAGGSIGSSLNLYHKLSNDFKNIKQDNYYIGPSYSNNLIKETINSNLKSLVNFDILFNENFNHINQIVSSILRKKGIVAWFQDECEWGPRALGNRSLLADPSNKYIRDILNKKIKLREPFRPFAASILEEYTDQYFHIKNKDDIFPNMNIVLNAKEITQLNFPAIVHADGTSRIQTLNKTRDKKFYNLVKYYHDQYSCPILLNTSLNIDEPICESPQDVINSFSSTGIDCIILQNYILIKKN